MPLLKLLLMLILLLFLMLKLLLRYVFLLIFLVFLIFFRVKWDKMRSMQEKIIKGKRIKAEWLSVRPLGLTVFLAGGAKKKKGKGEDWCNMASHTTHT